jgi:hypothetical protein
MSFLDKIRNALAGPPHIEGGDDETDATLREEYGTPDEAEADVTHLETSTGGAVVPSFASSDAAEAAEDDLESEEAPPDIDP